MLKLKCPYCKVSLNSYLGFSETGEILFKVRIKNNVLHYEKDEFLSDGNSTFFCMNCKKDLPYTEESIRVADKLSLPDSEFKKLYSQFSKLEFTDKNNKCVVCGENALYKDFCSFECFVKYKKEFTEKKKIKKGHKQKDIVDQWLEFFNKKGGIKNET